jgi:predicted alpha/beta-hydrolase family hydrolase
VDAIEIKTPHGPARAHLQEPEGVAKGLLILGHGAGGGVAAPDLVRAELEARELGVATALVEQPYRVAGRKAPPPAAKADEAWVAVVAALRQRLGEPSPLITGGRSFGARVACRTAAETGASAVLCLAFPEHPPGKPEKSRQEELDAVEVPVLVIQGKSDPFGMPTGGPGKEIVVVAGNHGLKTDLDGVGSAVADWLGGKLAG